MTSATASSSTPFSFSSAIKQISQECILMFGKNVVEQRIKILIFFL